MSAETLRTALDRIFDNPNDDAAWSDVEEVVTGSDGGSDVERQLELARIRQEQRRNWPVVARLLELEVALDDDSVIMGAKHAELGRIYHEELLLPDRAMESFELARELRPDDEKVKAGIAEIEFQRANIAATLEQAFVEALDSDDNSVRVPMLMRAAEMTFRYRRDDEAARTQALDALRQALELEPENSRVLGLAATIYRAIEAHDKLADVLRRRAKAVRAKDEKIGVCYQLAALAHHQLGDEQLTVEAYTMMFEVDPSNANALQYLVEHHSKAEDWDRVAAIYEEQLASGTVRSEEELGIYVQLAMLNWKTRNLAEAAEPYFEKVRRQEPTHALMLDFFREHYGAKGEAARLMTILTDAQRATKDSDEQNKLAAEIASLAEGQENARRAIEQYKSILRNDPDSAEAREKLKALYLETESYNALVELYRQDLGRIDKDDNDARLAVLREIAVVYRDRIESDTALLTVLNQILQLDETDIAAVRDLVKVYESLGRWRDLLNTQQRLAELTDNKTEKINLLRAVAGRWLDQFSNVQNAIGAYEALLAATDGDDDEAHDKLAELYQKRRAWDKLYDLYETELDGLEGEPRKNLMLEMAKLAAERLNKGTEAIRLMKEVLVFDPTETSVLDQLERQAERQKDYPTVAHVLERRIEMADDKKARLGLLQKLGVLYADKIQNLEAATKAWRRVLEISPGHKRALRVLRQSYAEGQDWEGLEDLYASQDDFEGLADFLSTTADRAKDDELKLALSFRAAQVYEERLNAPERASRSYERVLSVDDKNVRAAEALLPLYHDEEKWSRLPGLYDILLTATDDVDEQIRILHKIAEITGGPLANKAGALNYAKRAYQLRPDDEGLRQLQDWSRQSGEWSAFIEVVTNRLQSDELEADRVRELKLMLAEVYAGEVEKTDEAVAMYRSLLEADPADEETARALEELLRAADRRDDLRWLFELKVGQASGEEKSRILEEWATVEEEVFGEPQNAVELLQRVVDEDPQRLSALGALTRLSLASDDYAAAVTTLKAQRDAASGEERVALETQLATLYLDELDNPTASYEACVRALEIDGSHRPAVALLERLIELPQTRGKAAESLERIYAEDGQAQKQASALRALLESAGEGRKLELRLRLTDVHEHELNDAAGAFEVILGTLPMAPADITLWDRTASLGEAAGRYNDLAAAYREHLKVAPPAAPSAEDEDGEAGEASEAAEAPAETSSLPDDLVVELCERAAVLHEEQLGDAQGSVPYLERMLAIEPTNERAFERLKAILNALERWDALQALYERTIEVTQDALHQIDLLHQAALVAEDMVANDERAIGYYQRIVDLDPIHTAAVAALERLYAREERFGELADLLETKLETANPDDIADIRQQLVELYLGQLEKPERVMAHLDPLLREREEDLDARALAERCLEVPQLRQPAAALLDVVYESVDDPRDLVRILEIRLEGSEDEDHKRELLHRIATLRDERLKDDAGAFEALRVLMPLEPDDGGIRARLLEVGQRLGEHEKLAEALLATAERTSVPSVRGEILMLAGNLYRDRLDDSRRAEKVYQEVLAIDPDDPDMVIPAARRLGEIYEEEGKHPNLATALATQVRLVADIAERKELYARIANLYEDILDDSVRAVEAWQSRLADDASDIPALKALERLYERTERWRELVEILHQLETAALEGDERKRCMVKAAEVLAQEIEETDEAINAWRAVLDDFGPEADTLAALSKLYKTAERWEDLAEVYDVWLSLTDAADERVELFAGLGDVRRQHLDDPHGALSAYHEVLTIEPSHRGARAALATMLEHDDPEIKRQAAETIGPLYEADGDAEKLLKVLDIEIESTYDPVAKLDTLDRALNTAEDVVGSPEQAFEYARRGVKEAIGEPRLRMWIDTAERLAGVTERWEDLLTLFEAVVIEILDAEVQQLVRRRAGELARDKVGDTDRAIGHYRAALDTHADDQQAMIALEELYAQTEKHRELLEILKLRAESAGGDEARIELLFRVAELQAGVLEERDDAILTYEDLITMRLDPRAVQALDGLYAGAERFEDLVALYERELDDASGETAADIRVKIAKVAHAKLDDTMRALDELGEALGADADHQEAIKTLETLLETIEEPDQRGQVAEMLEPVYLASHDWARLKGVLEARLEVSQDPVERGELLMRLATLYEEQLEDYSAALDTVAKRLHEEPSDEDIWSEVERLGRVIGEGSEKRVADIFASALSNVGADDPKTASLAGRAGELYAKVGDHEEALKWYRRSYEFSPDSVELFNAIDKLLIALGQGQERIDHYRGGLDHTFDDQRRVGYLHTIAELQRGMERDDDAVATLNEVLDIEQRNGQAMDALVELYQKNERTEDLADLYERRADLADNAEAAAPFRLKFAQLLAGDELGKDRWLDQLEMIVQDLPWHEGAIAALESMLDDEERKQRVVEVLRPLYQRGDDWKGLVKLNEERLQLADLPDEKVEVLMNSALLYEEQGGDMEKAFGTVREAFALVPDNEGTREQLERLAEALEAWPRLAESYRNAAEATADEFIKRRLYDHLATVCDERLDDPRAALKALRKLVEIEPGDVEALERMDMMCMLLADWDTLVEVLERKADNETADDERAEVLLRLGELKHDMLQDSDGAVQVYERALELAPESLMTLDRLIELYVDRDAERLAQLIEQRIEYTDAFEAADERHELILRGAKVYEEKLERPEEAIRMLRLATDSRPEDLAVLRSLERLFTGQEAYDDLLDNLRRQADLVEETEARHALRNKIGDLYISQFDNAFDALEQYRTVIGEDPDNAPAIAAARKIGEKYDELRLEVSALLEPVLQEAGRHQELVEIMELRFSAQTDPIERARTLNGIALIQEEQLDEPGKAAATLLRALPETPEERQLHDDINRLCELTGEWDAYADTLAKHGEESYDAVVRTDLFTRLGHVAEERLKDTDRAIEAFSKAAEQADNPSDLLESLDRLYTAKEAWQELGKVLERRIELTLDGVLQAELLYRHGALQIEHFDDKHGGLATLRQAAELNPEHAGVRAELEKLTDEESLFEEVAEALDAMYRVANDSAARAKLRNKRIGYAPTASDRVRLRLELAQMLEEESFDTASAQEVIEQAFGDDASEPELLAQLERLAGTNADSEGAEAWRRAADAVGAAVAAGLKAEEEGLGEGNLTPEVARDLYLRTAGWYRDHCDDAEAAEKRLQAALEQDGRSVEALTALEQLQREPGHDEALVVTLRKLAALIDSGDAMIDRSSSELRREAKSIAAEKLEDAETAEAIVRDMLAVDDADVWALTELSAVCETKENWQELYQLLTRRLELLPEPDLLRELRHQAAKVAADKLDDKEAAIDLYEQAFEDDPRDDEAGAQLRQLYTDNEQYEKMLRFTERLIDLADTPEARAELRLESARICIDVLNATSEGIDHLNAVLDEVPTHQGAVELLGKMLEKEGRFDELAEMLERQIDLAREAGEQDKELANRVRQSELFETRLNDPDRAIEGYLSVLEADGGFRPALAALARLYEQEEEPAKAAEMYERLLEGAEAAERAKLALKARDLFETVDDREAACRVIEQVLGDGREGLSDDDVQQLRDGLRTLYRAREAWDKLAELTTTEADEAEGEDAKVVLYRKAAEIHAKERDDHAAAAELLQKALDLKSDDRDLMLALCDELTKSGRGKAAIDVLQQVVESYGGRRSKELADIHHRIASAHLAEGDAPEALKELESARKMDPGSVSILYELGTLSLRLSDDGENGQSKDHLKRAGNAFRSLLLQRLDADSPVTKGEVFYHLALVSKAEGDKKKAKQMAERALANDKGLEQAKSLLDELKG